MYKRTQAQRDGYRHAILDALAGRRNEYSWRCADDSGYPGEYGAAYRQGWIDAQKHGAREAYARMRKEEEE